MTVQAQYPYNAFLLNKRSGQDEFSLQQQGGVYLDQSCMFFNNSNLIRKREREVAGATATAPINSFSLQTQLMDMDHSQLQTPNAQQNQIQSYHHPYQHQFRVPNSSSFSSVISHDLDTQVKCHREDFDRFLQAQGEALRCTLVEKWHRHHGTLLGAAEESVVRRLRDKEALVEKATRRNAELEARVVQLNIEAQVWQAKATAQEATAASFQAQLQQAIMSGGAAAVQDNRRGEDCGEGAEEAESAYVDPERVVVAPGPACKACRKRLAAVVLLPCRHLCLCSECDQVAQACPLCLNVRNSSIEAFLN
ncbi:hypothetical protein V6N13_096017 [Hibiscus sabdariffa]|uniref:RING-type domain-containing protein n=1 Tax=Hibiscus sabdariffa TaxID=183260 RepID=A0ABR2DGY6_9ROSI